MITRPARNSDVNFILSAWLKSYYNALKFYASGSIKVPYPKDDIFFQGHQARIKGLMASHGVESMVCVAPDDEDQIIGWIVFDKACVHYVYVKHLYQRMGVSKELMKNLPVSVKAYSHHTKMAKYINQGLVYDPYQF